MHESRQIYDLMYNRSNFLLSPANGTTATDGAANDTDLLEVPWDTDDVGRVQHREPIEPNYWGLLALILVFGTATGNILVCLAIVWERRLQNVTNYFLMSLAITDLMVAILVMPLGILTLVKGE